MKASLIFYLGISLLLAHELDAVVYSEWRLLYILQYLDDSIAYPIFVILHIVIFMALFILSEQRSKPVQFWFRNGVSVFLVVHAIIHFSLTGSDDYTFEGVLSNSLIFGSALLGAAYLLVYGFRKDNYPST